MAYEDGALCSAGWGIWLLRRSDYRWKGKVHDKGWKRALGMCGEEKEMLKEKNNLFYDKKKRKQACFMSSFFFFSLYETRNAFKKKNKARQKHFVWFLEAWSEDQR